MLSDEKIYECERIASIRHRKHTNSIRGQQLTSADDPQWHFARAIEAEVRKDDTELIAGLKEMLEQMIACHDEPECPAIAASQEFLAAASARLEGTP